MRIAFIQFVFYEYLGLMYLSSSLKAHGHETTVFILQGRSRIASFVDEVVQWRPDIAAVSIMTGTEDLALGIVRQLKGRLSVYTVFGGPHPTVEPGIIGQEGVDCVCIGEAERSLVAIADCLERGDAPERVPGAWFRKDGVIIRNDMDVLSPDLASIPRPDRSLYRDRYRALRTQRAGFLLGRGCPYQCTFCASLAVSRLYRGKGPFVRQRPIPDVIAEMAAVKADHGIRTIYLYDDTLSADKGRVLEFCAAYKKGIGLPFTCHIRADNADEEMIRALADAGCRSASFGIESGDAGRRNQLLRKHISDDQIAVCASLLRKHGIRSRTFTMVGLPGETIEDAFQSADLNARIRADIPWCALYQPLPGTDLWDYCRKGGLLDTAGGAVQPSFFKGTSLRLEGRHEFENLQKLFFYAVRFPALRGLVRRAVRIRPNAFFELLFLMAHAWMFFRLELLSWRDLVRIGSMNVDRYLPRNRRAGHASAVKS